jgi:hypothetical protein
LYAFLISIMRTTCSAHPVLDFIIVAVALHLTKNIRTAAVCTYVIVNT